LPPKQEQIAIVEIVNTWMENCDILELEIEKRDKYSNHLIKSIIEATRNN
jgi:restriction endonuclease S subunit